MGMLKVCYPARGNLHISKPAPSLRLYVCREEVGALCSESAGRPLVGARAEAAAGPRCDGAEDLLDALSAAYTAFPDLWLDPELRCATPKNLHARPTLSGNLIDLMF